MTGHKEQLILVLPNTDELLAEYHAMRKRMLFERFGRPYDDNHPDESLDGNHRRVLLLSGEPIGTIRIDIDVPDAIFRLVTIREDLQGHGFGRRLVELSEDFARSLGCHSVLVNAATESVRFWEACGYSGSFEGGRNLMKKNL